MTSIVLMNTTKFKLYDFLIKPSQNSIIDHAGQIYYYSNKHLERLNIFSLLSKV